MPLGSWPSLLKLWLDASDIPCELIEHKKRDEDRIAFLRAQDPDHDVENCECGVLSIDGIHHPFVVDTYHYSYSVVRIEGIEGSCVCNERQPAYELADKTIVSDRHPGLRWLHDGTWVDVDEMHRLWKAGTAYPFRPVDDEDSWMPCIDAGGNFAEFEEYSSNEVVVTDVLDFIRAHVRRLRSEFSGEGSEHESLA